MTEPVSNDTLAATLESFRAEMRGDIHDLRETVLRQNGRIGKIELARAEEKGARDAIAETAANTAAALERATNLREKSRKWKATVIVSAAAALGTVVTVGTLVAHALIYHAI